jgi:hypothetical protein
MNGRYPCSSIYFRTVSIDAFPIVAQKYPSLQKIFLFQNSLLNSGCVFQSKRVLPAFKRLTICADANFGMLSTIK